MLLERSALRRWKESEELKGFKVTLSPLDEAIDTTLFAWRKANKALGSAEDQLDDLLDMMEEQEATVDDLTEKAKAAGIPIWNFFSSCKEISRIYLRATGKQRYIRKYL